MRRIDDPRPWRVRQALVAQRRRRRSRHRKPIVVNVHIVAPQPGFASAALRGVGEEMRAAIRKAMKAAEKQAATSLFAGRLPGQPRRP